MILSIVFLALFPFFETACYALLFWKRRELFFLKRNESAIIIVSLAGWLAYFTLIASIFNVIPCGAIYIASSLVAPLSMSPQLVRALLLRGRYESTKLVIEEELSSREQRKGKQQLSTIPSDREYKSGDVNKSCSTAPSNLVAVSQEKRQSDLAIERAHKLVRITKWVLILMVPLILILTWCLSWIEVGNLLHWIRKYGDCQSTPVYFTYAKLFFDIISLILAIITCILVKNIDDELFLHYEITETALLFILTSMVLVPMRLAGYTKVQPLLQTMQQMVVMSSMIILPCCPEIKGVSSVRSWFRKRITPSLKSTVPRYAQPFPQYHRGSTVRASIITRQESKRMTIEANTSWDAGLCILLSSEDGINAFTRHCAREFSSENILFWCAINDYRDNFSNDNNTTTTNGDELEHITASCAEAGERSIIEEACDIYSRFIDDNSTTQVNLSSKQKSDIKAAIDSADLKKDTFDAAQKEIFSVMSRDSYPRFLASKKNKKPM